MEGAADGTRPALRADQAALQEIVTAEDSVIRLRVHDASRVEWIVAVPLPRDRPLAYQIDVELEVPASAAGRDAPWEQLQTLSRLDGPAAVASSADLTIDALRRGAVTLTRMLARAKEGFVRHCASASAGANQGDVGGEPFLTIWLDAALRAVHDAREKLTHPTSQDSALISKERVLVDEYVSVRLLDMLAEADRAAHECAARATTRETFEGVFERIARALEDEMAYRRWRNFLETHASSPDTVERYIARAASLKKHF